MKAPLVSKNRAAAELREKAHKIRHDLVDATNVYTAE
jgi:hypothetical protein